MCAEWEILKQRSAEKGQNAREQAACEYEERKARRDAQEQARIDKLAKKNPRNNVARNLDDDGIAADASPPLVELTPRPPPEHPR